MYLVGNDTRTWRGEKKTIYFVFKRKGPSIDIVTGATGNKRFFKTYEAAERVAALLNGIDAAYPAPGVYAV